jgi:hypothetical protein
MIRALNDVGWTLGCFLSALLLAGLMGSSASWNFSSPLYMWALGTAFAPAIALVGKLWLPKRSDCAIGIVLLGNAVVYAALMVTIA